MQKNILRNIPLVTILTYKDFLREKILIFSNCKTNMDFLVCIIAFIYDFNFKETLEIIKEHNYIKKLIHKINAKDKYTKEKLHEIQEYAMKYIERKIKI